MGIWSCKGASEGMALGDVKEFLAEVVDGAW